MVDRQGWPERLLPTAESEDGVVQGLQHCELPIFGVQFHPESIATQYGHALLRNFLQATIH
jgi:anthranilate/para-aminobenzoate synthase component II